MISIETVNKQSIQWHYDLSTVFYRVLWGPHIHHGLWSGDESSETAQLKLTQTLARLAQIPAAGCDVLDVGCGMGGSSIYLAKHFGCRVTGVTLSPVQRWWATAGALWHGMRSRTKFVAADAEKLTLCRRFVRLALECGVHRAFVRQGCPLCESCNLVAARWQGGDLCLAVEGRSLRRAGSTPAGGCLSRHALPVARQSRRLCRLVCSRGTAFEPLRRLVRSRRSHLEDLSGTRAVLAVAACGSDCRSELGRLSR